MTIVMRYTVGGAVAGLLSGVGIYVLFGQCEGEMGGICLLIVLVTMPTSFAAMRVASLGGYVLDEWALIAVVPAIHGAIIGNLLGRFVRFRRSTTPRAT